MRRIAVNSGVVVLLCGGLLAGCSPNEQGKKVITEQCIADGEAIEVCECLAATSAEKLDKPMFDMVVLGAQGAEAEVAGRMEELAPELRTKFAVVAAEISRTCGVGTVPDAPAP
jgi:biotin synthase-related radical SAM superfamily protein